MINETTAKRFLGEDKFQWLIVLCCQLIFVGFVCSRAFTSIGMISLLLLSLIYYGPAHTIKQYLHQPALWLLSLFFFIVVLSGLYSDNTTDWLNWVRIKLPFIAMPLAFAPISRLPQKKFISILSGYLLILSVSVAVVLGNYFLHYESINHHITMGGAIPMPFSHIRFTLMVAFALFCCWYLLENKYSVFSPFEKWLQLFLLIFLFIGLHILTVRSSLLVLYAGILLLLFRFIFVQKNLVAGIALLALLVAAPYIAIKTMPSLSNKLEYMSYDKQQFLNGEVSGMSDGIRLVSMQGGLAVARQHLLIGVGAGDLKAEMENFYATTYPRLEAADHKMPHNQLIWTLASTGIIGLTLFLIAFGFPLYLNGHYKNWLFLLFHLVLFSSFFTEATLEEQMGTGFYLTLLLVLLNHFKKE